MDWMKLRSYSRKIRPPKNTHCASPLPGVSKRKAKTKRLTLHQDLLSKLRLEAHGKRQIGNVVTKGLPKIQEISEVTQMNCLSVEQSAELNYNENRTVEVNKNIKETDMTPLEDSLNLNSASKKSLINNETTSGMTLPTGVSEFLLDCLDADSSMSSSAECSDSTSIYSSPETFRDDRSSEGNNISPQRPCLGCRNSTLLDTSKAINIDKIPQLPDLSNILGGQDRTITRSLKQKQRSGLSNPSAIVAGKQVCRILPTKELASQSQSSGALLLPPKQNTQLVDQLPEKMKCIKKVTFKSILKNTSSTSSSSGENKSNEPCGVTDEMLDADMEFSSRSVNPGKNKALLTSTAFLQPEDLEHPDRLKLKRGWTFHRCTKSLTVKISCQTHVVCMLIQKKLFLHLHLQKEISSSICVTYQKSALLLELHQNTEHQKLSSIHWVEKHCSFHQDQQKILLQVQKTGSPAVIDEHFFVRHAGRSLCKAWVKREKKHFVESCISVLCELLPEEFKK